MKISLFFLLFFPTVFFAQVKPQDESFLTKEEVAANKIKTVKITTLFITSRDKTPDTATTEIQQYDVNGNMRLKTYFVSLDNSNFSQRTATEYNNGALSRIVNYENDSMIDSTVYSDQSHYVTYRKWPGKFVRREVNGDDITETGISGKDTVVRKWKSGESDVQPPIKNTDSFARADTSFVYNYKGKRELMIVNRFDSLNHLVNSDYYNYSDKNYLIYSARYTEKMNMVFYAPISRKGKRSYQVSRKYNANGLLSEKRLESSKKGKANPVVVTNVEYSYY
ncbi:MAG: hypothetical protein M3R17_08980 [Bacteroidota bacterium]|nr:hypothetical protein [Bacteroidota bacterium]